MADINWGNLLTSGLGALGNYWAGNQLGNSTSTATQNADPFGPYRGQYAGQLNQLQSQPYSQRQQSFTNGNWNQQLNALQANPSSVSSLPGYQFGMDQGTKAIEHSQAAKGLLNSGSTGTALERFGQNYAGQQFNNQRDFLAGQANSERNFAGQQFGQEQNFLGMASGANNNPSTAALAALAGRGQQLGAYNQGLGSLLGGGTQSGGGLGGLLSSSLGGQGSSNPLSSFINQYLQQSGSSGLGSAAGTVGSAYPGTSSAGMNDFANMEWGSEGAMDAYNGASGVQTYPYMDYGAESFGAGSGAAAGSTLTAPTATEAAIDSGALGGSSAGSSAGMGAAQWAPIAALAYAAYQDYNAPEEHNGDLINRIGSANPEQARQMQLGMANGVIGDFQKALDGTLTTNPFGVGSVNADSIYATYGSQYLSTADKAALKAKTDALFTPENYKAIQQWASNLAASNAANSSG